MLETLTSLVRDTLIARARDLVETKRTVRDGGDDGSATSRDGIIVLGPAREFRGAMTADELATLSGKKDLDALTRCLAGATVVVAASLGGLDANGLLDAMEAGPPRCIDDGRAGGADGWTEDDLAQIGFRVFEEMPQADGWREVYRFALKRGDETEPRHLTVAGLRGKAAGQAGDPAVSREPQSLCEHRIMVAREAEGLARALGLDNDHAAMLAAAARLHDQGKARNLWQDAMRAPKDGRRPYAKTRGGGDPRLLKIGGHPYRHEFGSLKDAEADPALHSLPEDLRDLALHLIAAHHGHARPLIAPVDPDSPTSRNEAHAGAVALRFARVQRQWGPGGLAWWEAVLRAADQRASRRLNETAEGDV